MFSIMIPLRQPCLFPIKHHAEGESQDADFPSASAGFLTASLSDLPMLSHGSCFQFNAITCAMEIPLFAAKIKTGESTVMVHLGNTGNIYSAVLYLCLTLHDFPCAFHAFIDEK